MGAGSLRNQPCPCGSGKKFKRCCLTVSRAQARLCRREKSCSVCGGKCQLSDRRRKWFPVELLKAHGYGDGSAALRREEVDAAAGGVAFGVMGEEVNTCEEKMI
jgi:SEC-C motif